MLDLYGIEANKRALLNDLRQLIEEALQPFADNLREFLERVRAGEFGSDWRVAWQNFVETQAEAGFNIEADSATRLVELMQSWDRQSPRTRASEPTTIAVQSGHHAVQPDPRFMLTSMKKNPKVRPAPSPPPRGPIPEVRRNEQGLEIAGPGPLVTDSFRKKTLEALKVLDPGVAVWWCANSVQGDLRSRAGAWYQGGQTSFLEPNERPVVIVDQHYTAGQAAQAIIYAANTGLFADSIAAFYKKHKTARSKNPEEFRKWQKESVAEAGRQASVLAEMYVNGIATLTPSGDLVVTIGELAEGEARWDQLLSILPLLEKLTTVLAVAVPISERLVKLPKSAANKLKKLTKPQLDRIKRIAKGAKSDTEASELILRELGPPPVSDHHIATNKNTVSALSGGPWTPKMQALFERAGLTLDDKKNIVRDLPWHGGKHSREYHEAVYDRLSSAVAGLTPGKEYRRALLDELGWIAHEVRTPGSKLHELLLY